MEKRKYFIQANKYNLIDWIGIEENGEITLIKMGDYETIDEYKERIYKIEQAYPGTMEAISNDHYELKTAEFFEEEEAKVCKNIEPAPEVIEEQTKSHKGQIIGTVATLGVAAALLFNSKFGPLNADARTNFWNTKNLKDAELNPATTEQQAETEENNSAKEETTTTENNTNLENKSVAELLNLLNENGQKEAFKKITTAQDDFNEDAAKTVKQEAFEYKDAEGNTVKVSEKQLFVTFDETSAAYLYANAFEVPAEDLAMYFGNAKVFDKKPNGNIKEALNQDIVTTNYVNFSKQMIQYYQLGGKVHTGMDQLFENEEEAKFFYDFETLVLEYNKSKDEKTAQAIRDQLIEIYMAGTNNSIKDKFPGATALISTTMLPHLHTNGVIDNEKMETYENIYETKTCNDIKNQLRKVEEIVDCKIGDCANTQTKVNGKENILEKIDEIQDKMTLKLDRNMNMTSAIEGYSLEDLEGAVIVNGVLVDGGSVEKTETKTYSKENVSKSEAVNLAGSNAVSKAEQQARQNDNIDALNQAEEQRAQQLIEQNEKDAWAEAERQRAEYDRTHSPVVKVETEEYFVSETNTSVPTQTQTTTTTTKPEPTPASAPEVVYEEPVQQVVSYSNVTTEEVEEYFVYENEEEKGKARTR